MHEIAADGTSFRRVVDALGDRALPPKSNTQAYARCPEPGHGGDTKPSLSITWKDGAKGGRTLINCHRGCDWRDVLAAIGLEPSDSYDTPPFKSARPDGARRRKPREERRPAQLKPKAAKDVPAAAAEGGGRLELVDTYTYTDADGVRIFDVRRWRGGMAKFSVRTYSRDGGRVVAKKAPAEARRVLLNLPAVVAAVADGAPVYLGEGEKDAKALEGAGVVASSHPFGAATPDRAATVWLPQYTETLRGAHVVLVADRDSIDKGDQAGGGYAGYRHVLYVAGELDGVAASVRIVEPAGTEPADAHDHLVTEGRSLSDMVSVTVDELSRRVAKADALASSSADKVSSSVGATQAEAAATAPAVEPVEAPADPGEDEDQEQGADVVDLGSYRNEPPGGDRPGGGGGDDGGAGDGGDREPYTVAEIWDRFENDERGIFHVKIDRDKRLVNKRGLLRVGVRRTARILEHLPDGSDPVLTHMDLVAFREGEEHVIKGLPVKRWETCEWIEELPWEVGRDTHTNGRSLLKKAIAETSDSRRELAYGALGWHEINGQWCYVHAGGVLGADGPIDGVRVNVVPPLRDFALPEAPATREELRAAVLASTAILDAMPARLAAPLLGAAYRGVLGFCRATVMPVGPRGGGKTGIAALAAQHYAPSARYNRLPGAGAGEEASTRIGLTELRFRAGDMVLPLDDLAPDKGPERASRTGAEIARSQFNRSGRIKSQREGGIAADRPARGLALVTGEETPAVPSAESRIVSLRVSRGDVDVKATLPALDSGQEPELRAKLTAAMVTHYAPRMPLTDHLEATEAELREAFSDPAADDPGMDARRSEGVADLAVGWRAMLSMATKSVLPSASPDEPAGAALTEEEAAELWERAWAGLVECKQHLMAGSATRTAADRVRDLLRSALMRRDVALRDRERGDAPANHPELYGWEEAGAGPMALGPAWRMPGTPIGWTDGTKVMLHPGAAFPALLKLSNAENDPLSYTRTSLGEELADSGKIRTRVTGSGVRRTTVSVRCEGSPVDVWEFDHEYLFPSDSDDDGGTTPPTRPVAPPLPSGPESPAEGPTTPPAPADAAQDRAERTPAEDRSEPALSGPVRPSEPQTSPSAGNYSEQESKPSQRPAAGRKRVAGSPYGRRRELPQYRALAAVCGESAAWLARPGDTAVCEQLPDELTLEQLLDWCAGQQLGHVDGRGQYAGAPEACGQVWILPKLRKALGWPATIEDSPKKAEAVARKLEAAGWRVVKGQDRKAAGGVNVWISIARGDGDDAAHLDLMVPDWLYTPTPFGEKEVSVQELANRLARYAEVTGIAWKWSAGWTGTQLAVVTRPQLMWRGRQTMPRQARPDREGNYAFRREPAPDELDLPYVHLWDVTGLYLSAATSTCLAWGEYEHVTRPTIGDPSKLERPGYWKVRLKQWKHARLPDPFCVFGRGDATREKDGLWVTTPTLRAALKLLEWDVEVLEGWLAVETLTTGPEPWGKTPKPGEVGARGYGRLLDKWARHLGEARNALEDSEHALDAVVRTVVKDTANHAVGRFDSQALRPDKGQTGGHIVWRPDWRNHLIAQARYAITDKVLKSADADQRYPLALPSTDGIVYAAESADPEEALPSGFKLGTGLGQVTHEGVMPMSDYLELSNRVTDPGEKPISLTDVIRAGGFGNG